MKKILLIGDEIRRNAFFMQSLMKNAENLKSTSRMVMKRRIFTDYDILFDLNFDDDPENYSYLHSAKKQD